MNKWDTYKYSETENLLDGARWAHEDEMKRILRKNRLSDASAPCYGGFPVISDGDTVYVDDTDTHSLIIGSTGSKKSRLFAMPMLELFRRAGESVVVTDPKGELHQKTASWFAQEGYQVQVLNFRDPSHSNGWNPFTLARRYYLKGDIDHATSVINDFANAFLADKTGTKADPFWIQTSRSILRGLSFLMIEGTKIFKDEEVNILTLQKLSQSLDPEQMDSVYDLDEFYQEDSLAFSNLMAVKRGTEKTFDNIMVSYDADMQKLYIQKSLIRMLSYNEMDFAGLGNQKTILYLIMPDEKTTMHVIVSMVIKQCYEQLISLAQEKPGNVLPVRVNFLLDEFSNLPAIPDMPSMISAARSRNIRFHLIIQGLYQLSSKYGEDDAQTIKGNCANWAFLTSRELPLLEEISQLCGSDSVTGKRLISVSQLQRLDKFRGEVLMLVGRQYPFIAHLADISDYVAPEQSEELPLPTLPDTMPPSISAQRAISRGNGLKDPEDMSQYESVTDYLLAVEYGQKSNL